MYNDELIWQVINHGHCAYKTKVAEKSTFCRNKYNYNGLCNRSSCPLANSQYATILEDKGKLYLCMKTVERAHLPSKMWERVRLSKNYTKALAQVSEHLEFWPKLMVHRNKQRLTKIYQYLLRVRRIEAKTQEGTRAIREKNSVKRSLRSREAKALKAADLNKSIEKELLERLKSGTYGDIYNFPEAQYEQALEKAEKELGTEEEFEEGDGEEARAVASAKEFIADDDDEEDDDDDDDDDEEDNDEDELEDIGRAFAAGSWGVDDEDDPSSDEDDQEHEKEGGEDDDVLDPQPPSPPAASSSSSSPGLTRDKRGRSTDATLSAGAVVGAGEASSKRGKAAGPAAASHVVSRKAAARKRRQQRKQKGPHVEIEYENEAPERQAETQSVSEW